MDFPINLSFSECLAKESISEGMILPCDIEYKSSFDFQEKDGMFYYIPLMYKKMSHVIAFDLDWTLSYNEKSLFPRDPDDIEILPGRREYLVGLIKKGYSLVIFTNQKSKTKKENLKRVERVRNFLLKMALPIYTFISTREDEFRKPSIGMFTFMKSYLNNITKLYYVGDALGRPQDFSDSDKVFGENIGAIVLSPEQVFPITKVPDCTQKEMVVFVGAPGTGKTTYAKTYLPKHVWINQDVLKTKNKVNKTIENSMKTLESIVVDATHPTHERRRELYDLAKKYNYTIKILYFVRNGYGWNKIRERKVPDIVYHMYFKKFESPIKDGYDVYTIWF